MDSNMSKNGDKEELSFSTFSLVDEVGQKSTKKHKKSARGKADGDAHSKSLEARSNKRALLPLKDATTLSRKLPRTISKKAISSKILTVYVLEVVERMEILHSDEFDEIGIAFTALDDSEIQKLLKRVTRGRKLTAIRVVKNYRRRGKISAKP